MSRFPVVSPKIPVCLHHAIAVCDGRSIAAIERKNINVQSIVSGAVANQKIMLSPSSFFDLQLRFSCLCHGAIFKRSLSP